MALCENMGASKLRKIAVNELWSDDSNSATVQDLKVYGWDKIDLIPNRSSGNDPNNLVTDPTNKVTIYGDLAVMGAFTSGGADGATIGDVKLTNYVYEKDSDTAEADNGAIQSISNHLLLKAQSSAFEVVIDDSRLVAHKAAKTSLHSEPDAFAVRGDNGNENQQVLLGMVYDIAHKTGSQTGSTNWRSVVDGGANDMELVSDAQVRISADSSSTGRVRLAAGSSVEICPSVGANRGQDPDSKLMITHSVDRFGAKIAAVSKGGASSTGEHIWITGDTAVANSSVTVEEVKFIDSSLSTANAVISLQATDSVDLKNDVILTNSAGTAGSITTSIGPMNLTSESGGINVDEVNVSGSGISTDNAVLSLDAQTSIDITSDLILTNTAGTAGSITTAVGSLNLTSASGGINVDAVNVVGSAISTSNAVLSLDADSSVDITSDLILTNSAGTAGSITTATGSLDLTSAAGGVNVQDVNVTGSSVSTTNAILGLQAATSVNVTSDLILLNSAGVAGSVTTSAGPLNLTSTAGGVNVQDVNVTGAAVSTTQAVMSLEAATSVDVMSDLILTNTAGTAGSVTTSVGSLNLTSFNGDVNVASVKVNGASISTSLSSMSLDAASNIAITSDLVLTNTANSGGDITTSVGPLNLTSVSGGVNVQDVNVTGSSITTAEDVMSLSAAISVDVNSDLVLKNALGTAGKITTSVGPLELSSATGDVTINGNLNILGTTNSINQTTTNIAITDKVISVSKPADTTVSSWPFDAGTPSVDITSSVSMSVSGGAAFEGEKVSIPSSGAFATATSALYPATLSGFQLSTNMTMLTPLVSSFLMAYGSLTGAFYRLSFDVANDWIVLSDGTHSAHLPAGLVQPDVSFHLALRRDPQTKTILVMTNYVSRTLTEAAPGDLAALYELSLAPSASIYLGHFGGDTSSAALKYDDVRLSSVTSPTNASSSGAGMLVEGDGKVNNTEIERSLKWNANASQDRGDHQGSYWHIQGGQLMLSRTIDTSLRKAPGTSVLLSSLPLSTTEVAKWAFDADLTSEVGSLALIAAGTTPASVSNGVLKTNNTSQANGSASVTSSTLPSGNSNITVIAHVAPQSALNTSSANGLEILAYGNNTTPGAFLRVFTSSSGKLSVTDGTMTDETVSVVVGLAPFVLALQLVSGVPKLFINGVERVLSTSTVSGVSIVTKRLSLGADVLMTKATDLWFDDVRVCDTIVSGNGQLYRYRDEYDATPVTVTYGFRIADDESLQIVKSQGSDSSKLVLGNPYPANAAGVNSMGMINSGSVDIVTEMLNKP